MPNDHDLLLTEANELLRSAYAIASRDGAETNWPAFRNKVFDALVRQNMALRGTAHPDAAVVTPKTFRIRPEPTGD